MTESRSYVQILRSSSIIGGAQLANMAIAVVRTKLVAVLIGPAGVGLVGVFLSIAGLASTLAGLGIQTSGVRKVAKHHGEGDGYGIASTMVTLRRVCWVTGMAGMLLLIVASPWVSQFSFGTKEYTVSIAVLGVTIFIGNLTAGQSALMQGTRRIGDLARVQVVSSIAGTVVAICFYWWLGLNGIVPSLIALAVVNLGVSTVYARRVPSPEVRVSWRETRAEARELVNFGINMVIAGLVGAGATYSIQVILTNEVGLKGVGIYSAAFSLSGMFVQFVLQAMGADFYPRLTAVSHDQNAMRQLINEQTEVALLLAFPGLLATLALAPLGISIFYTAEFAPAAEMLRWLVLGCMARVLSWPVGFSLLSTGKGKLFAVSETVFHGIHVVLVLTLLKYFDLVGAAIAFLIMNTLLLVSIIAITRFTIGFRWSGSVINQLAWMTPVAAFCFLMSNFLTELDAMLIGTALSTLSGLICVRMLLVRLGPESKISRILCKIPGCSRIFAIQR